MENSDPHPPQDSTTTNGATSQPAPSTFYDRSASNNIFQFPPDKRLVLYQKLQQILEYADHGDDDEFQSGELGGAFNGDASIDGVQCGLRCQQMREVFEHCLQSFQNSRQASASHAPPCEDVDQFTALYSILDELSSLEETLYKRRLCLQYARSLSANLKSLNDQKATSPPFSDNESELEQSISLLDTVLTAGSSASHKRNGIKQQRERSKSAIYEDIAVYGRREGGAVDNGELSCSPLRRQNTYSEGKSKVSKWTKVKAAFKWERANVPAVCEGNRSPQNGQGPNGIGLTPVNNELARYLRVPVSTCGGGASSADSVLSSSSGHFLSDAPCTPGTISSASSMDDLDGNYRNGLRRDSSKSDTRCDSRISDDGASASDGVKLDSSRVDPAKPGPRISNKAIVPTKSSSNKSLRKNKLVPDFEVLPEDVVADLTSTAGRTRTKLPPKPLDLNLRHDLNGLDEFYSSGHLRSPKEEVASCSRYKKVSSPGNSSVPSSPSRLSDFFAELESEDLSSGDYSEPTSPSHATTAKTFEQNQEEINKRYDLLRKKLDLEFKAKRREWEKQRTNPNVCRATAFTLVNSAKSEELQPSPTNLSAKLLEESLTPDFKKKLRKWRVKKQISLGSNATPSSSGKEAADSRATTKVDWNLWKSGQMKLEGQGLRPLPDQRDLPEEFQRKLEQWNKIKKSSSATSASESLKRTAKHSETGKKGIDDDRGVDKERRSDRRKISEKEKGEKLSKLKAIVADHPAKEIEVKTSAGVMKFEGISRKFTRKLYEWEKARGIGPESSTFALLHPGYCPIDVGRIPKDTQNNDHSPTLSRSLSLDSVTPNVALSSISKQASSLSLNDVNDLKEMEGIQNGDLALAEVEFKKFEEPEAVMVEVEDHIVETASPLIPVHAMVEQQTPIYKYEQVACNDYCNTKHIQSYESHSNLAPLLAALKRTEELMADFAATSAAVDPAPNDDVRQCQMELTSIRNIYLYYVENLMKPTVLNAISDVQGELSRLSELQERSPLDEACCRELMEERSREYHEELRGLQVALELLRLNIQEGGHRFHADLVPDINVTSEDGLEDSSIAVAPDAIATEPASTTLEATDELSGSVVEEEEEATVAGTPSVPHRNLANGAGGKKKLRLRKFGSRQNSKTESDSSSDDDAPSAQVETPRRWKRKNYRTKQRSFDEDSRKNEDTTTALGGQANGNGNVTKDDISYVLKIKPGHPIEQCSSFSAPPPPSKVLISPTESCVQLMPTAAAPLEPAILVDISQCSNVFVPTQRRVFATIEEPNSASGIAVVALDPDVLPSPDAVVAVVKTDVTEHMVDESNDRTSGEREDEISPHLETESRRPDVDKELLSGLELYPASIRLYKSFSWNGLRELDFGEERKSQSTERLSSFRKDERTFRHPLATDSFRTNKILAKHGPENRVEGLRRREHRFRKNTERTHSLFNKSTGSTLKRIESRMARSSLGSNVPDSKHSSNVLDPNHSFSLPKDDVSNLCRAMAKVQGMTQDQTKAVVHPIPTQSMNESLPNVQTPLSERAQRLQRAKEEFLQGTSFESEPQRRATTAVRSDTWELSRHSACADAHHDEGSVLKSPSAGTIPVSAPTLSDPESGQGDSLPRSVSRSRKISSKLGFATLASKLRLVRGPKEKSTASTNGGQNSLLALCRQALLTDVVAVPHVLAEAEARPEEELVQKSHSSQAVVEGGDRRTTSARRRMEAERLNKSQSEQYVRPQHRE